MNWGGGTHKHSDYNMFLFQLLIAYRRHQPTSVITNLIPGGKNVWLTMSVSPGPITSGHMAGANNTEIVAFVQLCLKWEVLKKGA